VASFFFLFLVPNYTTEALRNGLRLIHLALLCPCELARTVLFYLFIFAIYSLRCVCALDPLRAVSPLLSKTLLHKTGRAQGPALF